MMKNKINPHQSSEPDPFSSPKANYAHYLFEFSSHQGLIDNTVDSPQEPVAMEVPRLPDSLFVNLPEFLKKVVAGSWSNEQRDVLLLGALVSLSACFPKMYGFYAGSKVYPNLFLFFADQSPENNDHLSLCKQLVLPVHNALMEQSQLMQQQAKKEGKKYKKLPEKGLLIPVNSVRPGVFKRLADNDGQGLIIESDWELIAKASKIKIPNFNIGLRKGFHHETISYYAISREGYVEIDDPCLSVLLSGHFKQVSTLIPCAAHGLFSRFMFYFMHNGQEVNKVSPQESNPAQKAHFDELGKEFLGFYEALNNQEELEFHYTKEQQNQFNYFFSLLHDGYGARPGVGFGATIRRLGLIAFRLSMILTAFRHLETRDFSPDQKCLDVDLQASLSIVRVLVKHASVAYSKLPYEEIYARKRG